MTPRDLIPRTWLDLVGNGPLGVGLDLATTQNATSNPSSLVLSESVGSMVFERLVIAWKTNDDRVTKGVLTVICEDLLSVKKKPRGIAVDASSEKFLCTQIAREFTKYAPVRQIVSGEKTRWKGEDLTFKELLGNLYSALYEDALIATAEGQWIIDDRRLVQREKGSFAAQLGPNGEHGDTFDGGKLAYWCLVRGGRAQVTAAGIGSGSNDAVSNRLKNWLAKKMGIRARQPGVAAGSPSMLRTSSSARRQVNV